MKRNTLFLIFFIPSFILSQEIFFSKDSLYFSNLTDGNPDTIWMYNYGNDTLKVDSILSVNYMGYGIEIFLPDSSDIILNTIFPETDFSLGSHDSAMIIFWNPDICPICKVSGYEFFNDTIVFVNNSLNTSRDSIPASGIGFLYGDDGVGIYPEDNNNFTYELFQNYPNPFNPETKISFHLPKSEVVTLLIFNSNGQIIDKLLNKEMSPGTHQIIYNGKNLPSGLYFYKISAGNFSKVKKMLLIK